MEGVCLARAKGFQGFSSVVGWNKVLSQTQTKEKETNKVGRFN
jgi:hypothetical protein